MKRLLVVMAATSQIYSICPTNAQQPTLPSTCVESGRSKICYETKLALLNKDVNVALTVPADAAIDVMKKAGLPASEHNVLMGCRVIADNPAAQTEAVFAKVPQEILSDMRGSRIVDMSKLNDGRLHCQFERGVLSAAAGPYTMQGEAPKEIAPCAQKLVNRINAASLTVKRQTRSTMFFETEHNEFTSRCALNQDAITGAISGTKICKPTMRDLVPLFDMVGAPEKDRKKLLSLVVTGMRKSKRGNDGTVTKWNAYELTISNADSDCLLIVYPPESAIKD